MRILLAFVVAQFVASCGGVAFDSSKHQLSFLGRVARGGAKATDQHEPVKATNTILSSIARVEKTVLKAVEDEIHTIYSLDEDKKAEIVSKAQKAVEQGTAKVKKEVQDHSHPSKYPFEGKSKKETPTVDHKDRRILHAVEEAELAVLRAIESEFGTVFHETDHHETTETAKQGVKIGVKKATGLDD
jgi:hypothetical protein